MTGILSVLAKAIAFVLVIVTGYVLKKKGFFQPDDFYLVSKVVVRITLPCAIISNLSGISLDRSLLFLCVLGLAANIFLVIVGYLMGLKGTGQDRAFNLINLSGYNVGNFSLPFVQSFLGPVGFAATSLFDAGNAVMCTGVTYTVASLSAGNGDRPSVKNVTKSLLSSLPFDAYMIMTLLAVFGITLPRMVINYAGTVGNANTFLALLMIGIGFEIHMEKDKLVKILQILGMRYVTAILLAIGAYFFLPFAPGAGIGSLRAGFLGSSGIYRQSRGRCGDGKRCQLSFYFDQRCDDYRSFDPAVVTEKRGVKWRISF